PQLVLVLCVVLASSWQSFGQDAPVRRGRKYKAPPATSHIEVEILKKFNGKPIMNAAVVFNPSMDGKDLGNLEVKTGPDGKATIDVIPIGSTISVQVIATGFATYAEDYQIDGPKKAISISMLRPQAQLSAYQDNEGKASVRKPGVQEPIRPKPATPDASASTAKPAQNSTTPEAAPKQ
ncbi:MAG: hypothetical protein ABI072_04570, partial [Edaphobacter sp.]